MVASDEFAEFFDSAGAIGLFCVINPVGSRFGELNDDLPIAKSTVNTRLNEAQELGLLTKETVQGSGDATLKLWAPTERGMEIYYELRARGVHRRFSDTRQTVREYEWEQDAFERYLRNADARRWQEFSDQSYTGK